MNREKRYLLKRENWEKQERERELKEINKASGIISIFFLFNLGSILVISRVHFRFV